VVWVRRLIPRGLTGLLNLCVRSGTKLFQPYFENCFHCGSLAALVHSRATPNESSPFAGAHKQRCPSGGSRGILLREVVPALRRLAILANAGNPVTLLDMREVEAAACRSALQ
jgi:hypothetical protein